MTRHPQIFQISIFMFIEPKLTFKFPKNDFAQKRLFKDIQLEKGPPCWQRSFFKNAKTKYVQEFLALTFHGIVVVKNFNSARRISKFVFSGLSYFDQSMNSEKYEFCDSPHIAEVFWMPQCREKLEPIILEHISFLNFRKFSQIRGKRQKSSEFA